MILLIILTWSSVVSGDHYIAPDGSIVFFPSPDQTSLSAPVFISTGPPQGPPSVQVSPPFSQDSARFPNSFFTVPYASRQFPLPPALQPFVPQPQLPFVPQPQLPFVPQLQLPFVPQPQLPFVPQPQLPFVPQPQLPFVPQPQLPFVPQLQLPFVPQPSRPQQTLQNSACGASGNIIHETRSGKNYHFSWCVSPNTYTWDQANSYCSNLGRGFQVVSIQDKDKDDFVTSIIARNPIQFIWTSGNKRGSNTWRWSSGYTLSYTNWSHTGGLGRPQPDNREGNEDCLGVLKNIYNDGIKWHDIACHHVKSVICETSL